MPLQTIPDVPVALTAEQAEMRDLLVQLSELKRIGDAEQKNATI